MIEDIFLGRARILESPEKITIEIPAPKDWLAVFFVPIWLCGWLFGLTIAAITLISGRLSASNLTITFIVLWFICWFVGGSFSAYSWLKMMFGIEISEFSSSSISIGKRIFGVEQGRSFNASGILRLRKLPTLETPWIDQRRLWTGGAPSLTFDYGSRTIRFGRGIDEAEATQLLERIVAKFPQYQTVALTPSPWNQAFRNRV